MLFIAILLKESLSIVKFCDEGENIFSNLLEYIFPVSHQILNINQTVHAFIAFDLFFSFLVLAASFHNIGLVNYLP